MISFNEQFKYDKVYSPQRLFLLQEVSEYFNVLIICKVNVNECGIDYRWFFLWFSV